MIRHVSPAIDVTEELVTADPGTDIYLTGWACNTSPYTAKITVYAVAVGEPPITGTEIYAELTLLPYDTFAFTPVHLESGESLHVKSNVVGVVFSVTGQKLVSI